MGLRRRTRLKPETLVSFPGSQLEDSSRPRFRDGTTLEGSICNFCFPSGFASAEEDVTEGDASHLPARERIFFTVNSGALKSDGTPISTGDSDPLCCVGLRTVETITVKRLVAEICDLNYLCVLNEREPCDALKSEIDARLQVLMKISTDPQKRDEMVTWRAQYCYVLVSRSPILTWLISVVELFRSLCRPQSGAEADSMTSSEYQLKYVEVLNVLLTKLQIGTHPWARRTVSKVGLNSLLKEIKRNKICASSHKRHGAVVEAYVTLLADWTPPVLPVTIRLTARALIILLYFTTPENVGAVQDFFDSSIYPCDEAEKCALTRLLEPFICPRRNSWVPGAIQLWQKINDEPSLLSALQIQLSSEGSNRLKLVTDEHLLGLSDVLLPIAIDLVPVEALMWLFVLVMLEHKIIVTGGSSASRSALIFLLRASCAPFKWPHAFIPVLPASVGNEILDSPVPFLASMRKIPAEYDSVIGQPRPSPRSTHRGRGASAGGKSTRGRSRVEVYTAYHCNRCAAHAYDLHRTSKATTPCQWHLHYEICQTLVAGLRNEDDALSHSTSWVLARGSSVEVEVVSTSPFLSPESIAEILESPCTEISPSETRSPPTLHSASTQFGYQSCECSGHGPLPSCCEISHLSTEVSVRQHQLRAKELRWRLGFTRWDGGVLNLTTAEDLRTQPTILVPTRLLNLFSGTIGESSSPRCFSPDDSDGEIGFENLEIRTARSSQAGRDHYSPWSSLFGVRRMTTVPKATYGDDMHFVLTQHLRYHLPYYWHISSTPVRRGTGVRSGLWINDLVQRMVVKPFVSMRGVARPYLVPACLTFAAAACSKLQTRSKCVFALLRRRIRRDRLSLALLRPLVKEGEEGLQRMCESDLTLSSAESIDESLSAVLELMVKRVSELEEQIRKTLNDLKMLQSLSAVACLTVWQCRMTWPIRLTCHLFKLWVSDQNRVSDYLLRSREDVKYRHIPQPPRRRMRSAPACSKSSCRANPLGSSVRRHSVFLQGTRTVFRGRRESSLLEDDGSARKSSEPAYTYGASTPMPLFGPFGALSWSSSTTSSSPTLLWSPRGPPAGGMGSYSTRSALWEERRANPSYTRRMESPQVDTDSCATPHRRESLFMIQESIPDNRHCPMQWNYFTHHMLLRSVFECWIMQNRDRAIHGSETTKSSIWDSIETISGMTGCTCCCVGGSECYEEFDLVRLAARSFLRDSSGPVEKSGYSLSSLGLFTKRKNGTRKLSQDRLMNRVKRKISSLCDDVSKFDTEKRSVDVDVEALQAQLQADLEMVVREQVLRINDARQVEESLSKLNSTSSDKEMSEVMDRAKNCVARFLVGPDSLSDRGIQDSSIEGVDDWLSEWAQISVKLSQWKIILQQAFGAQMVQSLVGSV